jgi:hypothetical protein
LGAATVTAVEPCPEIACGEGSVITGRFVSRQVDEIARVEILAPDGTTESLEAAPIHPILSVDRQDWLRLGELSEGEQLQAAGGVAVVLSLALFRRSIPVYNIEVHGEHVYQVGELGLLVHNVCEELLARWGKGSFPTVLEDVACHFNEHSAEVNASTIVDYMRKGIQAMISRRGRGVPVEGFSADARRFDVHGVNRYVDFDAILGQVISFGIRR